MKTAFTLAAVLFSFLPGVAHARQPSAIPSPDPRFVRVAGTCQVKSPKKQVFVFKQWHLAPGVDTNGVIAISRKLPQFGNQKAIYEQLDEWIRKKEVSVIFAEGCPYPRAVDLSSPERFNGWSMAALEAKASTPEYPDIVTNVVYKLEAKWKSKLKARCGDDAHAMKKILLAFSDARGIVGFMTRIEQFKNDPVRRKPYMDGVIELYHLSPKTTVKEAMHHLDMHLKVTVDTIEHWINVRNEKLVDAIVSEKAPVIAAVFGGAHAVGIEKLLQKRGIGCTVLEPKGYHDDEVQMLKTLKKLVNQRLRTM